MLCAVIPAAQSEVGHGQGAIAGVHCTRMGAPPSDAPRAVRYVPICPIPNAPIVDNPSAPALATAPAGPWEGAAHPSQQAQTSTPTGWAPMTMAPGDASLRRSASRQGGRWIPPYPSLRTRCPPPTGCPPTRCVVALGWPSVPTPSGGPRRSFLERSTHLRRCILHAFFKNALPECRRRR
jgi:hypothetical protein